MMPDGVQGDEGGCAREKTSQVVGCNPSTSLPGRWRAGSLDQVGLARETARDAVHCRVVVELLHQGQEFLRRRAAVEVMVEDLNPTVSQAFFLFLT